MRISIRYALIDPTKNYTLLVESPVPPELQPRLAARLMEREGLAEQVGFVTDAGPDGLRLRMAGGEFCGNAAMSAAVLRAENAGAECGAIPVRMEGAEITVTAGAKRSPEGGWTGTVEMPKPISISRISFPGGETLPVVSFPGIAHAITDEPLEKGRAEALVRRWCAFLRADAAGILQFDRAENRLTPLVYVPAADTLFWESSCASGTAAVGYLLAAEAGVPFGADIAQPGGDLAVSIDGGGVLRLSGSVRVVRRQTVELEI